MPMGTLTKIIIVLMVIFSCTQVENPVPENGYSDTEKKLFGTWQYQFIAVGNQEFTLAEFDLNPRKTKTSERQELFRRRIYYGDTFTYQLRFIDRGDYQLGTENTENFQPEFGAFVLDEENDSLIHNAGTVYETRYAFTLDASGKNFTRTSFRYMSGDGPNWNPGQYVIFKEVFTKVEE